MATHQEIAQITDEEMVQRMVSSHSNRFDAAYWDFFAEFVAPKFDGPLQMVDVGCGPGLFLRDLRVRYPDAALFGSDVTEAMINYAQRLSYSGTPPAYQVHDITSSPLPFEAGSVDFLSMVAVLHVLNDPFAVCEEIKRVLSKDGVFLLQDWVRAPLPDYIEQMQPDDLDEGQKVTFRNRMIPLFTVHNRYTLDDWLWLLGEAGFQIRQHRHLRSASFCTFVCEKAN